MRATVSTKGQVVIPALLRKRLGIDAGTELDFREESGRLVLVKVFDEDPISRVYGMLRGQPGVPATTAECISLVRHGWPTQ